MDYAGGFRVPAVIRRQQIGVCKDLRDNVRQAPIPLQIPERIENFDVARCICSHPGCRGQLRNRFAHVNCELGRLEIVREFLRRGFASPVRVVSHKIELKEALRIGLESTRIEPGTKCDGVVGCPFLNHSFGIEQSSIWPLSKPNIPACFEVLHDGTDTSQRHARSRADCPVRCLNNIRLGQQNEDDPESGGIQSAKIVRLMVGRFCQASHIDQ